MGTRRELETVQEASRLTSSVQGKEISELRSRIDIGPKGLSDLQNISNRTIGADQRGQQISNAMFAYAGIFILILTLAVTLIIKLA
jgi:hypothetical protein